MSDEAAFLRAIQANGADATTKLVYADWLDEQGESEKAKYVREVAAAPLTHTWQGPPILSPELQEMERRLPRSWAELFSRCVGLWDPLTMRALGRLQGFLSAFDECNSSAISISYGTGGYMFHAGLELRSGTPQEMAEIGIDRRHHPVQLEPLGDWRTELQTVLDSFLFVQLGKASSPEGLTIETEVGHQIIIETALQYIGAVIKPEAGWRITYSNQDEWNGLRDQDLMLEGTDRVLFLYFSYD
jgi:uncharacterized protein (TIGR02996 family)